MQLNLPEAKLMLKKANGKVWIFDGIRKKYVVLTPEEWVRQHVIAFLTDHLQYPKPLIRIEGGLRFNTLQKRSDIVVFDRLGKPWMLIECKSPKLTLSSETIHQVTTYNTTLQARFVVLTNGLKHFCFDTDRTNDTVVQLADFPRFPGGL